MRQPRSITIVPAVLLAACLLAAEPGEAQPSAIGQWISVNAMPFVPVHTHTLPTGKVAIWGGVEANAPTGDDPREWDPATQGVRALTKPGFNILCSGHAFMADGSLFVAGGHERSFVGLKRASRYLADNTWRAVPDMNDGRWYPTVTTLANGDVLVVSGQIDLMVGVNTLPQVFQAGTGTWRNLAMAELAMDLYPYMFLAPNGKVFHAGPETITRYLDTAGTGTWTEVGSRIGGYRDYGSAVMYAPGKILLVGGGDPPTNSAEVIDLNQPTPTWRAVGSMQFARRQLNATLLPDGKVLVTGGTSGPGFDNASEPVLTAEVWDPGTERDPGPESWTVMANATVPRLYHSAALLLPDGRVLTTGGNGYVDAEVYSPPYLDKGARPVITSAPTSVAYGQPFSVLTPDAADVRRVTLIRLSSVTHAFDQNQRFNELSFVPVPSALTVTAPARATDAPPGHYMLFVLNANGVPSAARIVRLGGVTSPPAPPVLFILGAAKKGPGSVASSPPGITCGSDCSQSYAAGTGVTLTATPNKKARFVGWSGACTGTGLCSITMDAAKSVVATFSQK